MTSFCLHAPRDQHILLYSMGEYHQLMRLVPQNESLLLVTSHSPRAAVRGPEIHRWLPRFGPQASTRTAQTFHLPFPFLCVNIDRHYYIDAGLTCSCSGCPHRISSHSHTATYPRWTFHVGSCLGSTVSLLYCVGIYSRCPPPTCWSVSATRYSTQIRLHWYATELDHIGSCERFEAIADLADYSSISEYIVGAAVLAHLQCTVP